MFTLGELPFVGTAFRLGAKIFLDWFGAKTRREIERFNDSADQLRAAFSEELAVLRGPKTLPPGDTYDLLKGAFKKHCLAVDSFREFIPDEKRSLFDDAWRSYYCGKSTEFVSNG